MADALALSGYNAQQLRTIKATVAKGHTDIEFNLFMEACRSYRLDPFRRQIFSIIYSPNDEKKRKQTIIVSRDGNRILAQRCKDYRPQSEPAQFVYDKELIGPTNPKGIVSVTVRLWKQDNKGEWYPVIGEADWDEYAPLSLPYDAFDWVDTGETWSDTGKPKKRKVKKAGVEPTLDDSGQWAKMPKVMLAKCAESQALRAGWPDQFGNVYSEEEMDRFAADVSASEEIEHLEQEERKALIGGPSIMMVFDDAMKLEAVPIGKVFDRCDEFLRNATPEETMVFHGRNTAPLREFWAHDKAAGLKLKRSFETAEAKFAKEAASQDDAA